MLEDFGENIVVDIFKKFKQIEELTIEITKPACHVSIGFEGMSVIIKRKIHKVYIALGSNLGDREYNLMSAIKLLEEKGIKVLKQSKVIETEPYGDVKQDNFLNQVIEVETIFYPEELLLILLNIEKELKRERTIRWGPRTIDLDILLYDEEIINKENLIIPHYDMHNRGFVLGPLCDINRFAYHKKLKKYAYELLGNLEQ